MLKLNKPRPLGYWLPFHYHKIPANIRVLIASTLLKPPKINAQHDFNFINKDQNYFWPQKKKAAFTLTFDLDSKSGLEKILSLKKNPILKKHKATIFIPASSYPFMKDELLDIQDDYWEIALHGDNHDQKLPFASQKEIQNRLDIAEEKMEEMNVKLNGFRSPSLLYSEKLLNIVASSFCYDSSFALDDDDFSARTKGPFWIGKLLEIPITLPMDVHLLFHHISEEEKLRIWRERLDLLVNIGGHAVLTIHPDRHFFSTQSEKSLLEFIEGVKKYSLWESTCHEVHTHLNDLLDR